MKRILFLIVLMALVYSGSAEYQQYKFSPEKDNFGDEADVTISNSLTASVIGVCARSSVTQSLPCTHNGVIYVKCGTYINAYNANTNAVITSVETSSTYNHVDTLICGDNHLYSPYDPLDEISYFNYTTLDFMFGDVKNVSAQTMDSAGNIYIVTSSGIVIKYDSELLYSTTSSRYSNCNSPHIVVSDTNVYIICRSATDSNRMIVTQYDTSLNYITNTTESGTLVGGIIQSALYDTYLYTGLYSYNVGVGQVVYQLYSANVTRNKSTFNFPARSITQNSLEDLSINPVTSSLIFTSREGSQEAYQFGLSSISTYTHIAPMLNGSNTPYLTTDNAYFFTPKGLFKTTAGDTSTITESYNKTINLWGGILYNGKVFFWNYTHFMTLGDYSTTTTTTTLPAGQQCGVSSNCGNNSVCCNNTCYSKLERSCCSDNDCLTTKYCDTRFYTCMAKGGGGWACARDHECLGNNCTANANNSDIGDYPTSPWQSYQYVGVCIDSNISSCYSDSDCNATSFCSITGISGRCTLKYGENSSCSNPAQCQSGLSCLNGLCRNSTAYSGDDCSPNGVINSSNGARFWKECSDNFASTCADPYSCYCGYLTNTSTKLSCILRKYNGDVCSLYVGVSGNLESQYPSQINLNSRGLVYLSDSCFFGGVSRCMGDTSTGYPVRKCVSSEFQCRWTRLQSNIIPSNNFIEEFCPYRQYCKTNNKCADQLQLGSSCAYNEECISYNCGSTGVCVSPVSGGTIIDLTVSDSVLTDGSSLDIFADFKYRANGTSISGSNCTFDSSVLSYFNITNSQLNKSGSRGYRLAYGQIYAISQSSDVNVQVGVKCSKIGVDGAANYTTIQILAASSNKTIATRVSCDEISSCVTSGINGNPLDFKVKYYPTSNPSQGIIGASCTLTISGVGSYSMTPVSGSNGVYHKSYTFSTDNNYIWSVSCSKSGYDTTSYGSNVVITGDTCHNGEADGNEEGVDCGGPCPACPVEQEGYCDNGIIDHGETGIDCGGDCLKCPSCDDTIKSGEQLNTCDCSDGNGGLHNEYCLSGWCRPHWNGQLETGVADGHCRVPKCVYLSDIGQYYDRWQNGDETGIDCGGSNCQSCGGCTSTYVSCDSDGSQTCNTQYGNYTTWNCSATSDCTTIECKDSHGVSYTKNRLCINGLCKFTSQNTTFGNSDINMRISPLSNIIFKSGGNITYLGYCEDNTYGFNVHTDVDTKTSWQIGVSSLIPSVIANGEWVDLGDGLSSKDKKSVIPELCNWNGGTMRYAFISVQSVIPNTPSRDYQDVNMIIFNEPFKVNFTGLGDQINFSANRNAQFWIRSSNTGAYQLLNVAPVGSVQLYYQNITNTTSIQWFANSTYGESRTGTYGRSALYLFPFLGGLLYAFLFAWWMPTFSWWWIIPLFMVGGTVLPLTLGFFIFMYLKWREKNNE